MVKLMVKLMVKTHSQVSSRVSRLLKLLGLREVRGRHGRHLCAYPPEDHRRALGTVLL